MTYAPDPEAFGPTADVPAWVVNRRDLGWRCDPPSAAVADFHRTLPGYAPTPLVDLPTLATELGVGRIFAKDESARLGLPAFKGLGASWAVHRMLQSSPVGDVLTIVTATDGNHGRAVARFARLLGHRAAILIPKGVHPAAIQAIVDEGATVTVVDASYDDAVVAATAAAKAPGHVLVQDTAWPGYEEIPGWIVDGYDTLFTEIDHQLHAAQLAHPDLVLVPAGVGSLLQAALTHYRSAAYAGSDGADTAVVSVEPTAAACIAASVTARRPVTVDTSPTAMAGLNCGTPSSTAWPFIVNGLDAAATVSETDDIKAAHDLATLGVAAGPCGAAPLAAARTVLTGPGSSRRRTQLRLGPDATVVLLVTEGSDSNPVPPLASPTVPG